MRNTLHINLASDPFRRDRPFLVAAMAATAALAALLVVQIAFAWIQHSQAADARDAAQRTNQQLQLLVQEQARLQAVLRQPQNAEVIDYSIFLNDLLRRKGISWTRLFSDLEAVMPYNTKLVNIRPQIDSNNQVRLDMTVAAQSPDPVIDLLKRLESSRLFGHTSTSTFQPPTQNEPLYRYQISCNYAPES